jgi:transposase
LTEARWQQVAPLLPPQTPPRGRPALDHRRLLEVMLWVMHTSVPWRELPDAYGAWHTLYSRDRR